MPASQTWSLLERLCRNKSAAISKVVMQITEVLNKETRMCEQLVELRAEYIKSMATGQTLGHTSIGDWMAPTRTLTERINALEKSIKKRHLDIENLLLKKKEIESQRQKYDLLRENSEKQQASEKDRQNQKLADQRYLDRWTSLKKATTYE